jgi:aspartyl-tRNA(Asn)/glutamyl-tRNA(Gln) amidotransferase subunit A
MHDKTIAQLSAGLAAGEFSSEELTRAFLLERIERFNPGLNAFITLTAESALARPARRTSVAGKVKPGR